VHCEHEKNCEKCSNYFFHRNVWFHQVEVFHSKYQFSLISSPSPQWFSAWTIKTLQPKDLQIVFTFQTCSFKNASKGCEAKLLKKKNKTFFLFSVVKIIARNAKFINNSKYMVMGLLDFSLQGQASLGALLWLFYSSLFLLLTQGRAEHTSCCYQNSRKPANATLSLTSPGEMLYLNLIFKTSPHPCTHMSNHRVFLLCTQDHGLTSRSASSRSSPEAQQTSHCSAPTFIPAELGFTCTGILLTSRGITCILAVKREGE